MVTVTNFFVRENKDGKSFVALELSGDIEMIQSAQTGRFYASAKRCTVSSVFSEEVARTFIGKQLPGKIERVECTPYDYTVKETGEVLSLTHTYTYVPGDERREGMEKSIQTASVV
ncbi:hypothetical protein A4H97_33720 [Niastella yeongjuensis]|uniref:Uncharacterized protein n=1 Tax=Niastella yeongjuensis TaxID=354355 RepID=A0A1V9EDG2_9BACT|nr:hypothetical protein [Niastella yeongjuensis]OQP44132.1 hypothetical protein A4H97_33720 [Niastella yeongjuensis]SEP49235.1 hypothetical protein SAMN05660816_06925 [Niastella yeongjuensis]